MSLVVNIVKGKGKRQSENFDQQKLHDSIVAACLGVYTPEGQAEKTADIVVESVIKWIGKRPEVTTGDIRTITTKTLNIHNPEAAYLYEQHHITI